MPNKDWIKHYIKNKSKQFLYFNIIHIYNVYRKFLEYFLLIKINMKKMTYVKYDKYV